MPISLFSRPESAPDLPAVIAAWRAADATARDDLRDALVEQLATSAEAALAGDFLASADCPDAVRAKVAVSAADGARRAAAVAAMGDEPALAEVALHAEHADTRHAAAERVHAEILLERLADDAQGRDRGVARLAKQRLLALKGRAGQEAEADEILTALEGIATQPGAILSAVVELNRRWQALDLSGDAGRLARLETARTALQARFDREQAGQLAKSKAIRHVQEWMAALAPPETREGLEALRAQLDSLREEATAAGESACVASLESAALRLANWARELSALSVAEALVREAELLAEGTSVDNAQLPERWQVLDRGVRTPALTRRFEAALVVVEQRRLAQVQSAEKEVSGARGRIHALLLAAEEALAGGHVAAARAAVDEMKALKPSAGVLPKPSLQRMGRIGQQLGELERWAAFGQQTARVQLCERAEALLAAAPGPVQAAADVKKLRDEWKALDQQQPGVPKSLWERFNGACEKAYAPAARHFAEQAAQRKAARTQREAFIADAAAKAATLPGEPPDWRAAEKWLRETDRHWREGGLGSVDPAQWKKLDAQFREAVGPVRQALAGAREQSKSGRAALIAEAHALTAHANDRELPSKVKALQARWQAEAKASPILQKDERALWEQFRAACDALFEARNAKRKEADEKKQEGRKALDDVCAATEQLARATEKDDKTVRRELAELENQWRAAARGSDPALKGIESRFRRARSAVDDALRAKAKAREAAVWSTLAGKNRLCEALEALVSSGAGSENAGEHESAWASLPELPAAWEKKLTTRRDAALSALRGESNAEALRGALTQASAARAEALLSLEMTLGLDSPAELQSQRLALQVKMLKERFGGSSPDAGAKAEKVVEWCARPGPLAGRDAERRDRVFAAMGAAAR